MVVQFSEMRERCSGRQANCNFLLKTMSELALAEFAGIVQSTGSAACRDVRSLKITRL
jgi:hypothetical protein